MPRTTRAVTAPQCVQGHKKCTRPPKVASTIRRRPRSILDGAQDQGLLVKHVMIFGVGAGVDTAQSFSRQIYHLFT